LRVLRYILPAITIWLNVTAQAAAPGADAIIARAYETKRVDDQISTLSFTFSTPGETDRQAIYTMVWKNMHGEDGYDNKAIFFTEFPPEKKGIAYLGWLGTAEDTKESDEWIYLPELRMTRRIAHRDHTHAHDDDEFGNSLINRTHLDPRPPHMDDHQFIGEAALDGKMHYLVVSTPKHHGHGKEHMSNDTPAKTIHWIEQESYRTNRMQFLDAREKEILDMRISWIQMGDYWIWKSINATNPDNQAKTVLEFDKIKINTGLKDRDFSKRALEKGSGRFR